MQSGEKKLFLVTGHPRSGTTYTRAAFDAAGIAVGGEHWGREGYDEGRPPVKGIISWFHAVMLQDEIGPLVHQVRHPLQVIQSAQTLTNGAFRLMFDYTDAPRSWFLLLRLRRLIPAITRKHALHWAMHSWLHWNLLIERDPRVELRYRVEDIQDEWPRIMDAFRLDIPEFPLQVPCDTNTRKRRYVDKTLDDLRRIDAALTERTVVKATEYGYDLNAAKAAQD